MEKRPTFIIPLSFSSDQSLRIFQTGSKTLFNQNTFLCPMKSAIESAGKARPPLIPVPQPEPLAMHGSNVGVVVKSWLASQLRKPPPKAPVKRGVANRKNAKGTPAPESPMPVVESNGPNFVFITEYPRTAEQLKQMIVADLPVLAHVTCDSGIPVQEGRKGQAPAYSNIAKEWGPKMQDDLPFITLNITNEAAMETQWMALMDQVKSLANAFADYKMDFIDMRYVTIPEYPPEPLLIPQIPVDKQKRAPGNTATLEVPLMSNDALKKAYQTMIMNELDQWLKQTVSPIYSTQFQHYFEMLPKFPLPADLAHVLAHVPDSKGNEIFLMRAVSKKLDIPYDTVLRVKIHEKYEEMVGAAIAERRHMERIPLEVLGNVIAPLSYEYSRFEWCEFAGKLMFVFFHDFPKKLPIMTRDEAFKLPVYCGFKHWLDQQSKTFPAEYKELEVTTVKSVSVGANDQFMGFNSDLSVQSVTKYFCESGLRVDSYPPIFTDGVLSNLSFVVSDAEAHKFSFAMSQQVVQQQLGEEEEEEGFETLMSIRGVLSRDSELLFEKKGSGMSLSMFYRDSKVSFDIENSHVVISGVAKESHRIITRDGKLIRYAPHPIIYSPDGAIEECIKGVWKMVAADGRGYVKKDGKWFRQPKFDTTSDAISTHFTSRKVTNRSDGLAFIEDNDKVTVVFPDGTHYIQSSHTFTHPSVPSVTVVDEKFRVESKEFTAEFLENGDCEVATRDQQCTVNYNEEFSHILIQFGVFKNVMTMVDLVTGMVANVGARRCVYYLAEDWTWKIARQLCSKKEVVQHFQNGDILERLQACTEMDDEELQTIIANGHKPRMFLMDKEYGKFEVYELLDESVYKSIAEKASENHNSHKDTLWFDTKPRSFRQIHECGRITPEEIDEIKKGYDTEILIQRKQKELRDSVGDPKWRVMAEQEEEEERKMKELYQQFGVADPIEDDTENVFVNSVIPEE